MATRPTNPFGGADPLTDIPPTSEVMRGQKMTMAQLGKAIGATVVDVSRENQDGGEEGEGDKPSGSGGYGGGGNGGDDDPDEPSDDNGSDDQEQEEEEEEEQEEDEEDETSEEPDPWATYPEAVMAYQNINEAIAEKMEQKKELEAYIIKHYADSELGKKFKKKQSSNASRATGSEAIKAVKDELITLYVKKDGNITEDFKVRLSVSGGKFIGMVADRFQVKKAKFYLTCPNGDLLQGGNRTLFNQKLKADDTLSISYRGQGGGKRGASSIGETGEGKGNKTDKIEQEKDNLRSAIVKAQMANGGDTSAYHQALTDLFNQLQANPAMSVSALLNTLDIPSLKDIQALLLSTRKEHKYQGLCKAFFGAQYQAMNECGKRHKALMDAQKALLTWCCLQEFGDDDTGSIAWGKFNKVVMEAIQVKMTAPVNPPVLPAPAS